MTDHILENYQRRALDARITITDLCKAAGVAGSTITRWRAGMTPRPATLVKIDNALAVIEGKRTATIEPVADISHAAQTSRGMLDAAPALSIEDGDV